MPKQRPSILLAFALAALVACDDKKPAPAKPAASTASAASASAPAASVASSTPAADASAPPPASATAALPASDPKGWVEEIKPRAVTAKRGDKVWAAVLEAGGMAGLATRFRPFEVVVANGNAATLKDAQGGTFENVSGAVITPRADASKLKPGDLVTALNGASLLVGKLVKAGGAAAKPKVAAWDEATSKVAELEVDAVEPLADGVAPLGWVAYPGEKGGEKRGIVFAVDGDRVYVVDAYGGWGFDRAKVRPWQFVRAPKPGDSVLLASDTVVAATVDRVDSPDLVTVAAKGQRAAFIGDLGAK